MGGGLSASEDDALLTSFLEHFKKVIAMRQAGKFDKETFDAYNAAMVQLSDEHVREMYGRFMEVERLIASDCF